MVRQAGTSTLGLSRNHAALGHSLRATVRTTKDVSFYKERLRGLTAEVALAEERERKRLAADLHDGLSQLIALAQMKLASLSPAASDPLVKPLAELRGIIEEANRSVRSLTCQLSPPVLHDQRLGVALEWLTDDIRTRYALPVRFSDDRRIKSTDEQTRTILFRSVRELLINAAKHAGAKEVRVALRREHNALCVVIEDDGVGMQLGAVSTKGSGLSHVKERVRSLGGRVRIDSHPGRGTKFTLSVPLPSQRLEPSKRRVPLFASESYSLTTTR